ncbi:MAG: hypothetical protein ABF274_06320 [Nonlabens sp.]|uniref:hypothetical protein n=1 Tax=Nonlabens sp. TaxID=1888209 RepID=UPI00321A8A26
MKKIEPFKSVDDALQQLDNGGRFYNLLTKADDGIITTAELGKVGGIFNDKQQMILFLELSLSGLDESQRQAVILKLDMDLKLLYYNYQPALFSPTEAASKAVVAQNTIITGVPKLTASKTDFNGFIMIPIMTGSVTTFTMVPIMDMYDVYEIKDATSAQSILIAHARSSDKLPEKKIQIAGITKELKTDKKEKVASKIFLEAIYYLEYET